MAYDRPARVFHKLSSTQGELPTAAEMTEGELAVNNNVAAPFLSTLGDDGTVIQFISATNNRQIPTADFTLFVATTGSATPANPEGGDPFDLLSTAVAYVEANYLLAGAKVTFSVAAGDYVEPGNFVLSDIGGSYAIVGAGRDTTNIQCNGTLDAIIYAVPRLLEIEEIEFSFAELGARFLVAYGSASLKSVAFTAPEFGGLYIESDAVVLVHGDGALGLTVNGRIRLRGELHLGATSLTLNRNNLVDSPCLTLQGGKLYTVDRDDQQQITINVTGASKVIELSSTDEIPYSDTLWTGDPVFIAGNSDRPIPLRVVAPARTDLEGPTYIEGVRIVYYAIELYCDPVLGTVNPEDPLAGDVFSDINECMEYINTKLLCVGYPTITVKLAAGTYEISSNLSIPNANCKVDLHGPDVGPNDEPTAIISKNTAGQTIRFRNYRGDIRWVKFTNTATGPWTCQVMQQAQVFFYNTVFEGTASALCELNINEGGVIKVQDSVAVMLEMREGYIVNDGEIRMGGHIEINRNNGPTDNCVVNHGVINAFAKASSPQVRLTGTSRGVAVGGNPAMYYSPNKWPQDPIFTSSDNSRPIPLEILEPQTWAASSLPSQQTLLKVRGNTQLGVYDNLAAAPAGAKGEVAIIGDDLCFHNGTEWRVCSNSSTPA